MSEAVKPFAFDTEFGTSVRTKKEPERKISPAQYDADVAAALERGLAQGREEARHGFEQAASMSLDALGSSFARLASNMTEIEARVEIEAVEVATAVGRKLAQELMARQPLDEVAALVREHLKELRGASHLVIRLPPDVADFASVQIQELAKFNGYEGKLIIFPDPDLARGDGRIEWAEGGIQRSVRDLDAEITQMVQRFLAARAQEAGISIPAEKGEGA